MVEVSDVAVQVIGPGVTRVRFFGPPIAPDASYVVVDERPSPPDPLSRKRERGSQGATTDWERGSVVLGGGGEGEPVSLVFYDGAGKRLFGTPPLLWNNQIGHGPGVDFAVPLLVASTPGGAYGLFFDTTAQARLDNARGSGGQTLRYEADVPSFDLYFLAGPTVADVMEQYAGLTGFTTMPPRWALGYLQSTRFFEDADDLLTVARTMREKQLPCDALIFLSTYGDSQGWNAGVGHLGFHPKLWAEPEALLGELQETLGYRVVTHEYPVLHPDAPGFAEADERGFLLGVAYPAPPPSTVDDPKAIPRAQAYAENQRFVDFTNPDARKWWWEQHRHLV